MPLMVSFRPARPEDYNHLRALLASTVAASPAGGLGYDDEAVRSLFASGHPDAVSICCEVGGVPAGVVLAHISPSAFNPAKRVAVVYLWAVDPFVRGLGAGPGLLRAVERAVSGRASAVLVMCGHGPAEACAAKASYAPYKAARIKYLGGDA